MTNLEREKLDPDEEGRYLSIIELGNRYLKDTALVVDKPWKVSDEQAIRRFYLSAVKFSNPKLRSNFGSHLLTASIFAGMTSDGLTAPNINPIEFRILGWIHDIGTLIAPGDYFRKDLIGRDMLVQLNIRKEVLEKLPDIPAILGLSSNVINSIKDVTLMQMIVDVADNLGKYNPDGSLFGVNQMIDYANLQPRRYRISSKSLPSVKAGLKALNEGKQEFAVQLLLDEIRYLQNLGINFDLLSDHVFKEVHKSSNKKWLVAFMNAREDYDEEVDRVLGIDRRKINMLLLDLANTCWSTISDEAIAGSLANYFGINVTDFLPVFNKVVRDGMNGKYGDSNEGGVRFLKALWKAANVEFPGYEKSQKLFMKDIYFKPFKEMQSLVRDFGQKEKNICVLSNIVPNLVPLAKTTLKEYFPDIDLSHVYFSCDLGVGKGNDGRAFTEVLKREEISATEVLFIDDKSEYTDEGRAVGIWGITLRGRNMDAFHRLSKNFHKARLID